MVFTGRQLRSMIDDSGRLTLSIEQVDIGDPGDDELVVRMEATPINPSDIGLLLGPADIATMEMAGTADSPKLAFAIPESRLGLVGGRIGQSLPVGNEGAGLVIAAGARVANLLGKRVGMFGGAMYADYRKIGAADVGVLPDGASAADGASMFINPLTALGFLETARDRGHAAIVHTPGASNLGQMLLRLCLADGVPLVSIVRSEEQARILRDIGATWVLNSNAEDFAEGLADAVAETGATVAFDAVGGGSMGSDILGAMERAAARSMTTYDRYGSGTFKELFLYGNLDPSPTILKRGGFGFEWSVSGWLLFPFLRRSDPAIVQRLRQRVIDELTSTFASTYTRTIGLAEVLKPEVLRAYERKATGEKFLIDPGIA